MNDPEPGEHSNGVRLPLGTFVATENPVPSSDHVHTKDVSNEEEERRHDLDVETYVLVGWGERERVAVGSNMKLVSVCVEHNDADEFQGEYQPYLV